MNVDEQTNCDGVEGLTITATLTEGTTVSTQQTDFADGIITFTSISAGDYTCSVTVEDETGPVESMQIQCTPSGKFRHACQHYLCIILGYSISIIIYLALGPAGLAFTGPMLVMSHIDTLAGYNLQHTCAEGYDTYSWSSHSFIHSFCQSVTVWCLTLPSQQCL